MIWLSMIFAALAAVGGALIAAEAESWVGYGTAACAWFAALLFVVISVEEGVSRVSVKPGIDIEAFAREHQVRFVRKDRSKLMRVLGLALPKAFMERYWTTIGRTIYYPTTLMEPLDGYSEPALWTGERSTIEHELHHVLQHKQLWYLHELLYLLGLPLPVLLAWYRWRVERVAYLHQVKYYAARGFLDDGCWLAPRICEFDERREQIDRIVSKLWRHYGWCWPRSWMRRWFLRELGR